MREKERDTRAGGQCSVGERSTTLDRNPFVAADLDSNLISQTTMET